MSKKIGMAENKNGTALIVALTFLAVLAIMTSAFVFNLVEASNFESAFEARTRSFYVAEAGLAHAIWKLEQEGGAYKGESGVPFRDGTFDIRIEARPEDPGKRVVFSNARLSGYPDDRTETAIRAVVTVQNSESGGFEVAMESWEATR